MMPERPTKVTSTKAVVATIVRPIYQSRILNTT
ncbi:Uncharacterised protein [Vibrio cholerae]|nr:Uncharacterised protein [Vibrio cholerae]